MQIPANYGTLPTYKCAYYALLNRLHMLKDVPDLRVFGANTKEETFRILEEQEIHLILLDLKMPEVDGFELYQMIRQKYTVPVVLMTADKSLETIQKISELGLDDYLTKPLNAYVVRETIHSITNNMGYI